MESLRAKTSLSIRVGRILASVRERILNGFGLELAVLTLLELLFVAAFPINGIVQSPYNLEFHLFDTSVRLDALEHERLSGVLMPVAIGLRQYGRIPAWNPYIGIGEPTINNPFNYLFNPFASLPVLIFGGIQGTKIALILALLLAGYNMWALARVVGIGAVGRVTAGVLYMMSGGIGGKFHAGHFQLGISLSWMPLVFAGCWWTLNSRDRRAPVLLAAAFALLFFAGNIYYTLHTLICLTVMVTFHLIERHSETGRLALLLDRLQRIAVGGAFAFGLAALQFVPIWVVQGYIGEHPGDPLLTSRYDLGQAVANFTFPWPNWFLFEDPNYNMQVGVDYAYIGPAAFLLIFTAVALLLSRPQLRRWFNGRMAWIALILAVAMMVWGAGQSPIIQYLYANIPRLAEFRFVGRAHAVAVLWWLVLVAIAVEILWKSIREIFPGLNTRNRLMAAMSIGGLAWALLFFYSLQNESGRAAMLLYDYRLKADMDNHRYTTFTEAALGLFVLTFIALVGESLLSLITNLLRRANGWRNHFKMAGGRILQLLALGVVFLALADVMQVNSTLYVFNRRLADFSQLYPYIQEHDSEAPFPAVNEPHSPFAFSAYVAGIRNWGLDEGWTPEAPPGIVHDDAELIRDVPRWALVWNEPGGREQAEQYVQSFGYEPRMCTSTQLEAFVAETCSLDVIGTVVLYELADALPYAFVATAEQLVEKSGAIRRETIFPAVVLAHRMDSIAIRAEAPADGADDYYLVVQETNFPGWRATMDGEPIKIVSVGRFIGVPLPPGSHRINLEYEPPGLAAGIVLFVITVAAIGLYLRRRQPFTQGQ